MFFRWNNLKWDTWDFMDEAGIYGFVVIVDIPNKTINLVYVLCS